MATFIDRVAEVMRDKGYVHEGGELNKSRFALDLGLQRSHGDALFRSKKSDPRMSTVVKIATFGGVTLDWLVLGRMPKTLDEAAELRAYARLKKSEPPSRSESRLKR